MPGNIVFTFLGLPILTILTSLKLIQLDGFYPTISYPTQGSNYSLRILHAIFRIFLFNVMKNSNRNSNSIENFPPAPSDMKSYDFGNINFRSKWVFVQCKCISNIQFLPRFQILYQKMTHSRSSHRKCSIKILTGRHLRRSLFLIKFNCATLIKKIIIIIILFY